MNINFVNLSFVRTPTTLCCFYCTNVLLDVKQGQLNIFSTNAIFIILKLCNCILNILILNFLKYIMETLYLL